MISLDGLDYAAAIIPSLYDLIKVYFSKPEGPAYGSSCPGYRSNHLNIEASLEKGKRALEALALANK